MSSIFVCLCDVIDICVPLSCHYDIRHACLIHPGVRDKRRVSDIDLSHTQGVRDKRWVSEIDCLLHPGVRDKRRVSEIDLSRTPGCTRQAPGV